MSGCRAPYPGGVNATCRLPSGHDGPHVGNAFSGNEYRWSVCVHCGRVIVSTPRGGWVDPQATGDDAVWRETCDANDRFTAEHEAASA